MANIANKLEKTQFKQDSTGHYIIPRQGSNYFEYLAPEKTDEKDIDSLAGRFVYKE